MGSPSSTAVAPRPNGGGDRRSARTRELILDAAEELFAERGIDGPSLNEINARAGQRNKTSLQYHFGSRDGLLQAILARHGRPLRLRREELQAQLGADGTLDDVRVLVSLHVVPLAEYLTVGRSERHYIEIWADVLGSPATRTEDIRHLLDDPVQTDTARRLIAIMAAHMPRELAVERLTAMLQAAVHMLADRARVENAGEPRRDLLPLPIVTANLVDMIAAALTTPVSNMTAVAMSGDDSPVV
jgi:AcrR family transcriptional regulator